MANFLEEVFIRQKLKNPYGIFLALGLAALIGYLLATNFALGIMLVMALLGLCVLLLCVSYPDAALYGVIAFIFFIDFFIRWLGLDFPAGVVYDILLFAGCLGVLLRKKTTGRSDGYFFRSPVVTWFLVVGAYTLAEVANPYIHNLPTWFNAFRKAVEEIGLLFLSFSVFTSAGKIRQFISVLLVCSAVAGVYAVFQQFHGLMGFERAWVEADPGRFELLFIQGEFRKFSSFSGPTSFGIDMSCCALLFSLIALYERPFRRGLLFLGSACALWGMLYSGTRTANVIIVAGLGLFILLGFDKKQVRVFTLLMSMVFLFALYVPIYSSQPLNRFRSSFIGSKDASYNLRNQDRAFIQPNIYTHPIGWGLGSTNGTPGEYVTGSALDGFQTDDQYLRIALETGWIGLIISCSLNFVILRVGIRAYFRTKRPERKTLYAAALACIFAFILAELAQEVIGQLECDVVLIPVIGMILRLDQMDRTES